MGLPRELERSLRRATTETGAALTAALALRFAEGEALVEAGTVASLARASSPHEGLARACERLAAAGAPLDPGADGPDLAAVVRALAAWEPRGEPVEALGRAHELVGSASAARKAKGAFYTPAPVVRGLVDAVLSRLDDAPSVLDPACGAGAFLLAALRRLSLRERPGQVLPRLHGVDLDARAVGLARAALVVEAARLDPGVGLGAPGPRLQVGDALVEPGGPSERPLDLRGAFAGPLAAGGFDAVVGNPPYLSFGGRERADAPDALRAWLEARYAPSGWRSAHAFFVARAVRELARRCVGLVLPDQVGHLDGYAPIRALLDREGGLVEVRYLGEGVFDGAVTPALALVWDREHRGAARVVERGGAVAERPRDAAPGDPWHVPAERGLLERLAQGSASLRPFLVDCGIRTTNAAVQVVPLAEAPTTSLAALEGKQVSRYRTDAPKIAVRLDRGPVFRSTGGRTGRVRFLIRQTAAYPIVGPRPEGAAFRNSLLGLMDTAPFDVRFAVGLLNAKLLRFAYAETVREASQRAFPQVKLGALGRLPIRLPPPDVEARVVALVDALLEAFDPALDRRLDEEVYALYELAPEEIALVERKVAALPPPPSP